jgi:hypothetical protein
MSEAEKQEKHHVKGSRSTIYSLAVMSTSIRNFTHLFKYPHNNLKKNINLVFAGDKNIKLSPPQVFTGTSEGSSFDEYFPFFT